MSDRQVFHGKTLGVLASPDPVRPDSAGGVINPAAARDRDGVLHLFPRLVDASGCSRIGRARVEIVDGQPYGLTWFDPVLTPRETYEGAGPANEGMRGCEDPRITFVEPIDRYVMAYAAAGPRGSFVALAVSDDLISWERLGPVEFSADPGLGADFNTIENKDAAVFPRAVVGPDGTPSLAILHRPLYDDRTKPAIAPDARHAIWMSYAPLDAVVQDVRALGRLGQHHLLASPEQPWESAWIGGGAPPVLVNGEWIVVYHGVAARGRADGDPRKPLVYSAGVMVLDAHDPRRLRYRQAGPLLVPEVGSEENDVLFPTGVDRQSDGAIDVYYGLADLKIGAARVYPSSAPVVP